MYSIWHIVDADAPPAGYMASTMRVGDNCCHRQIITGWYQRVLILVERAIGDVSLITHGIGSFHFGEAQEGYSQISITNRSDADSFTARAVAYRV